MYLKKFFEDISNELEQFLDIKFLKKENYRKLIKIFCWKNLLGYKMYSIDIGHFKLVSNINLILYGNKL